MNNFSTQIKEPIIQYGAYSEIKNSEVWNSTRRRVLVIDPKVKRYHQGFLASFGSFMPTFILQSGEKHKSFVMMERILSFFYKNNLEKNDLCVIVGGGLTLDIVSFAASIWKRGTPFAFIPTTLLAQVDACFGGKTGTNFGGTKNLLGTFAFPDEIIIDTSFLNTLPKEQISAGLAEIIKVSLISDKSFFEDVERLNDINSLQNPKQLPFLEKALNIKRKIVLEDPFEVGKRKLLNFGHTIGHAYEGLRLQKNKNILHGQSVAVGMAVETLWAVKNMGLPVSVFERLMAKLTDFKLAEYKDDSQFSELIPFLMQDKKNVDGILNLSIPTQIGEGQFNVKASFDSLGEVWNNFTTEVV